MKKYIKKLLVAIDNVCDNNVISRDDALLLLNELNLNDTRDIQFNLNNDLFHVISKNVKDSDLLYMILYDVGVEKLKHNKLCNAMSVTDEILTKSDGNMSYKINLKLLKLPHEKHITSSTFVDGFVGFVSKGEWC